MVKATGQRYREQLEALSHTSLPNERASLLEAMATRAEAIAGGETAQPESERWYQTAEILRAIAATERGWVLSDPTATRVVLGPRYQRLWTALASHSGENAARVRALMNLYEALTPELRSGAAIVCLEVADTERSVAGLRAVQPRGDRMRTLAGRAPALVTQGARGGSE
jgi:hypothetical protein